ncbi:dihydroxy-acid dehydratase [Alphaproteobacteria bacterium]|nr:dihydroxy-acid dehydratase [Alphaproteobacteria bacterium]|tara:strand:+ start:640 stop:2340 length:1701 start_codon:yes stop_codon:yes gene_type:complete
MSNKKKGMYKNLTSYGDSGFSIFLRKAFIKGMGYSEEMLGKPIIGITNTYSDYNPCHGNVPDLIKSVKAGILSSGAIPLEFPTITIHESFAYPTSMYLRNLMSIDTEEMLRAQPMDACVLIGGCDKTVPAQIMGAFSAEMPAIQLVTGPMLTGSHKGERVGACTDCRRYWAKFRAEEIDENEINEVNNQLVPTVGTCGVMGTASTMALITEALGMMVTNGASAPAVSAERRRIAEETGRVAVEIANKSYKPKDFLTIKNFQNALTVLSAIGGSTNGIVHLTAMAGRLGIDINLNDFDQMTKDTPMIVDLKPSGSGYMEDLFKSGGLPRILNEMRDYLHLDTMTVSGISLKEVIDKNNYDWPQQIIRKTNDPIFDKGSIAVLNGNLAPGSAIIKQSAASKDLLVHEGIVEVFEDLEDLANRIDSEDLNVTKDSILLLRNIGPLGAPGMPEAGLIPIPKKLAKVGVKDMVRISDGRMSGTASGTIVLHVCPEAAAGGNLNIVESGDVIKLDVNKRLIELKLTDEEIKIRHNNKKDKKIIKRRGYNKMFYDTVLQADKGVDFDFLRPVK